jgi:DNA segregation ATPase FtsK/SpoIIIE-like protein
MLQAKRRIGISVAARPMKTPHQHGIAGPARVSRAGVVLVLPG